MIYYLSWLTAIIILLVTLFEINVVFPLVGNLYNSKILLYVVYYSAALFFPLALLSSILVFKSNKTPYGKKSIKLLTNFAIVYAIVKIILVIISSFELF